MSTTPEPLYGLTAANARRVAATVRTVEGQPPDPAPGQANTRQVGAQPFYVILTAEDAAHPGRYQWRRQYPTQGDVTMSDTAPTVDSGADYSAVEINSQRRLAGRRVRIMHDSYDADGKPVYRFEAASAETHVTVEVQDPQTARGHYAGAIVVPIITLVSGQYVVTGHTAAAAVSACVVVNTEEARTTGAGPHWIAPVTYATGRIVDYAPDGTPVVEITGGAAKDAGNQTPVELDATATDTAAHSTTWTRDTDPTGPVSLYVHTRTVDDAASGNIYGFRRRLNFAADGKLVSADAETRYVITTTEEDCT